MVGGERRRGESVASDISAAVVRQTASLPVDIGGGRAVSARISSFNGLADPGEHVLVRLGPEHDTPLVRVHSECLTGDSFGSLRCDCGPQLREAFRRIHQHGGAVVYLRQEGRGIGLYNKIDAYRLQDGGLDTFAANEALGFPGDAREYTVAAQMLKAAGITRIALLSNNPDKAEQLREHGIEVVRVVGTGTHLNAYNASYLQAKADHHEIDLKGMVS